VFAWDLAEKPEPASIDTDRYAELLCRAAITLLQPLGVKEQTLRWWMFANAGYGAAPGVLPEDCSQETPLLEDPGWLLLNRPHPSQSAQRPPLTDSSGNHLDLMPPSPYNLPAEKMNLSR
jgi:hypothetical protein